MAENQEPAKLQYKVNPGKNLCGSNWNDSCWKYENKNLNSITKSYTEVVFKFQDLAQGLSDASNWCWEVTMKRTTDAKKMERISFANGIWSFKWRDIEIERRKWTSLSLANLALTGGANEAESRRRHPRHVVWSYLAPGEKTYKSGLVN